MILVYHAKEPTFGQRIAFHLDNSDKNKLIPIPEKLIYAAMNELEEWKYHKQPLLLKKIDLVLDTYRKFLRLPLSHYRHYQQWTEWD